MIRSAHINTVIAAAGATWSIVTPDVPLAVSFAFSWLFGTALYEALR